MKKVAFIILISVGFIACGDKANSTAEQGTLDTDVVKNPATAENASGVDGDVAVAEFTFEKEVHDFGKIVQGEKVAYSFKFKNTGKGDLIITSAKGSCGCTVPEYPVEPIAPGGSGIINVIFDSEGKSGQQNKKVTIVANTVPNTKVLAINGTVEAPVPAK